MELSSFNISIIFFSVVFKLSSWLTLANNSDYVDCVDEEKTYGKPNVKFVSEKEHNQQVYAQDDVETHVPDKEARGYLDFLDWWAIWIFVNVRCSGGQKHNNT